MGRSGRVPTSLTKEQCGAVTYIVLCYLGGQNVKVERKIHVSFWMYGGVLLC